MALPTGGYLLDVAKRALAAREERKKAENEASLQRAFEEYDKHYESFDDEGNPIPQAYATPDPVSKAGTRAKWSALGAPQAGALAAAGGPQPFDPLRVAAEDTAIGAGLKGVGMGLKAAGGFVGKTSKAAPIGKSEQLVKTTLEEGAEKVTKGFARQEASPEFKSFSEDLPVLDIGDPALKITRDNPTPGGVIRAFHGTNMDIKGGAFDTSGLGTHFGTKKAASDRLKEIKTYSWRKADHEGAIIPVHIKLKKPYPIHDFDNWTDEDLLEWVLDDDTLDFSVWGKSGTKAGFLADAQFGGDAAEDIKLLLQRNGYDGLVYTNRGEDVGSTSYTVFEPDQVLMPQSQVAKEGAEQVTKKGSQAAVSNLAKQAHHPLACGDCFRFASSSDLADNVVHANVAQLQGPHAWVERMTPSGERVFDWQTQQGHWQKQGLGKPEYATEGWPKDEFYQTFKPTNVVDYPGTTAMILSLHTRNHGPWYPEEVVKALRAIEKAGRLSPAQRKLLVQNEALLGEGAETYLNAPFGTPFKAAEKVAKGADDIAAAGAYTPEDVAEAKRLWAEKGTESPYFKRWSNNAPILDDVPTTVSGNQFKKGTPIVMKGFHGTLNKFDAFDPKFVGSSTGFPDTQVGEAYFFSSDPGTASWVGGIKNPAAAKEMVKTGKGAWEKPIMLESYLKMENPFVWDETTWNPNIGHDTEFIARLIKMAKERGHDGLVWKDPSLGDTYIVFSPTQIKSATGNRGTFDPADPHMGRMNLLGAGAAAEAARRAFEQERKE